MITETDAVTFRRDLGELLGQVQDRGDSIVIHMDGQPVAALIDIQLFERIRKVQDRLDDLARRISASFSEVPPSVGLAEIDRATADERARNKRATRR